MFIVVDDFVIFYRSKTVAWIERQLQININKISEWTLKNGFTVSHNKTVGIHFFKDDGQFHKVPELKLGNNIIRFVAEHKFLGLIWDSQLTFHSHIKNLLTRCRKDLNIIKVLSYSNWGSDTKTLLKVFRALIRSKLDYGCMVYMNAKFKKDLEDLNVLHRQAIRLCLGAFKSSPIESLYVEANEPPLELRRKELAMRYGLKIKSNPNNPTHDSLFKLTSIESYKYDRYPPLAQSLKKLFEEASIPIENIAIRKIPDVPIWEQEPNSVCFSLASYDKSTTLPSFFKSKFNSDILPYYIDYTHCYTDGSKHNEIAAYGIYSSLGTVSKRISNDSSIFTAEMEAIKKILINIKSSARTKSKFVVFCDSKSVLESIGNQESKNPIMINILDILQDLKHKKIIVEFCWVPSHVGITGNERADSQAKAGLNTTIEPKNYRLPFSDYKPKVNEYIKGLWQQRWDHKHNRERVIKLHYLNPFIKPYHIHNLSRKDEVIIHRLRIGHTRLTHRYLMEDPFKQQPYCEYCDSDLISVKHILIDCLYFRRIRSRYYSAQSLKDLFDRYPPKYIIEFIKQAGLYNLI